MLGYADMNKADPKKSPIWAVYHWMKLQNSWEHQRLKGEKDMKKYVKMIEEAIKFVKDIDDAVRNCELKICVKEK